MSEYMEKHAVSRLIGAPPGYVGYEDGGSLTEAVRRRPYQVILFDEIEKAHPDIFNVLLQVLDEGQLTDGQGRRVDFRNTLILLTSNIGSEHLLALAEHEDPDQAREQVMADVSAVFRPEFINRLDRALLFRRLSRDDMAAIVDLQLKALSHRLHDQHIDINVTDNARLWLVIRAMILSLAQDRSSASSRTRSITSLPSDLSIAGSMKVISSPLTLMRLPIASASHQRLKLKSLNLGGVWGLICGGYGQPAQGP